MYIIPYLLLLLLLFFFFFFFFFFVILYIFFIHFIWNIFLYYKIQEKYWKCISVRIALLGYIFYVLLSGQSIFLPHTFNPRVRLDPVSKAWPNQQTPLYCNCPPNWNKVPLLKQIFNYQLIESRIYNWISFLFLFYLFFFFAGDGGGDGG